MEIKRVFDLMDHQLENFPREDAICGKVNGEWKKISTQEYKKNSDLVSYGLIKMGIKPGEKIATISNNRIEWNFIDMGIIQIGAIHIPIYPTLSTEDFRHILSHSDAEILIVSDKLIYQKIKPIVDEIPQLESIFTINEVEGVRNWTEITKLGENAESETINKLLELKDSVKEEDLASIIYTSGTTGVSKGVMLTHKNFVSNFKSARHALPLNESHKILSFLPLCHVYEHLLNYLFQYKGIGIYYAQNIGTIVRDLQDIKPDGFDTVPRLLEKVYDTIIKKASTLSGVKKALFDWALNLGLKYNFGGSNGVWYEAQLKVANKLIFNKWREALGGNVKFIGSGGAALQVRLARVFWAAGIPVQEGYGLTETSPLIAFNYPKHPDIKFGTVGPVIEDVTVKIADDGEILVKGNNVMKGYYKADDKTKEVIDSEGWFHTGDVGELVENKFLKITDRKKEIFKLSSGKYISPQVVENKLKESIFIEQSMVFGENQKQAFALISPEFESLQDYANKNKINYIAKSELILKAEIIKLVQKDVIKLNKQLGKTEQIGKFRLVPDSWTPESGEMSQTLKLKRRVLVEKYKDLINELIE